MSSRFLLLCLCYGLTLVVLPGCEQSYESDIAATEEDIQVLRRGNGGEPGTLDPAVAEDVHAFNVLRDLYEGLVSEAADGSLIPGVAHRWDVSGDGLQYTFHLRDDAAWSDGSPVVADDFVTSMRRALAPDSRSAYAFLLYPILNARAVAGGEKPATALGVKALDSRTLQIELRSPASYFPGILAMPISFPLFRGEAFDTQQFSDPESFVGNGPYVLKERQIGLRIRLEKNPRFRKAGSVRVPIVDYLPIEDPDTEYRMYRAGDLDITATIPPGQIANIRNTRPDEVRISPSLALYYIALDLSELPMSDASLRRALSMAIDRDVLVELIGRGEQPAYGVVPEGVSAHSGARFDWLHESQGDRDQRARALYAEAGYGPEKPLHFTLMYDVGGIHETVALAVTAMWREVLGADVSLDKREWKYFLDTRENRNEWQAMRFAWFGDYNDASTFLDIFRSDSPQNLSGFDSPEYDGLLDSAARTLDPVARSEYLHQAESHLLNASPVIPLYFFVSKHLVSSRVANYEPNILDVHRSQYIELVEIEH
jgi:oligopeptide transport system substrate-binding protein